MTKYVNIGFPVNLETHLLIAGETGSGKSVCMNALISEIYITEPTAEIYLIDFKYVELSRYKKLMPVYCEIEQVHAVIKKLYHSMMKRFKDMEKAGILETKENHVYIFIDEYAEITFHENKKLSRDIQEYVNKIVRLGRSAGYHAIIATQHPTSKTVSMQLKMNAQKLCLRCNSDIGYRVVLDKKYCDLNGKGDCLYKDNYGNVNRFQVIPATDSYIKEFISECEKYI